METTQEIGTAGHQAEPSLAATCRRFNEAFNALDTKQVAAFWTDDGTLITPSGEVGRGREGVEKAFAHDCETILAGTRSRFTIASVRPLGKDLAFMDLEHELQDFRMPDGSTGAMTLHVVILARRSGDAWKWLDARPYAFVPQAPSIH